MRSANFLTMAPGMLLIGLLVNSVDASEPCRPDGTKTANVDPTPEPPPQEPEKRNARRRPAQEASMTGSQKRIYKKVDGAELPLYVFQPKGDKPEGGAPAIVCFFGGGWRAGNPNQFENHCRHFAQRGMVAITVEYRVSSRHPVKVEDCIEDAKSAMRWVRSHASELGIDPNRIAAAGGSAGGHLAACTALIEGYNAKGDDLEVSPQPNALVLFNPAMSLANVPNEKPDQPSRSRGPIEQIMPLTFASQKQPPCIMFFGTDDKLLEGARRFQQASEKAGNTCQLVTYEGQGHGFFNFRRGGGKHYRLTLDAADRFLVELGWLPAKS